jgi:hypothetical protein
VRTCQDGSGGGPRGASCGRQQGPGHPVRSCCGCCRRRSSQYSYSQRAPARGPLLLVLVLDPRLRASSPSLPGRSRPRPRPAGQGPGPAKGTLLTVSPAAVVHHRTSRRVSRSCRSSAGPCMVGWCTDAAAARARSCQSPRGWEPTVSEPVMVVIYNNVMRYICAVAI